MNNYTKKDILKMMKDILFLNTEYIQLEKEIKQLFDELLYSLSKSSKYVNALKSVSEDREKYVGYDDEIINLKSNISSMINIKEIKKISTEILNLENKKNNLEEKFREKYYLSFNEIDKAIYLLNKKSKEEDTSNISKKINKVKTKQKSIFSIYREKFAIITLLKENENYKIIILKELQNNYLEITKQFPEDINLVLEIKKKLENFTEYNCKELVKNMPEEYKNKFIELIKNKNKKSLKYFS